jgi:hypothetical protein
MKLLFVPAGFSLYILKFKGSYCKTPTPETAATSKHSFNNILVAPYSSKEACIYITWIYRSIKIT